MKCFRFPLAALALSFMGLGVQASDIMVKDAYARASLTPTAQSGAAYMMLMNHGAEADTLMAVSSPLAEKTEVHETTTTDGIMKMRAMGPLPLAPHETVVLAPGGNHIMFMGLKAPLKDGESLSLTLTFQKAGEMTLTIPIKKVGPATDPEHEHSAGQ